MKKSKQDKNNISLVRSLRTKVIITISIILSLFILAIAGLKVIQSNSDIADSAVLSQISQFFDEHGLIFSDNQIKSQKQRDIVGVILPQTGLLGQIGQYEKNAFDLAFSHLQKENLLNFDVKFEDGRSDKKAVAAAANKLIDIDNVNLLVTSTTGASLAAQPIAERAKLAQLAFCMGSDVARNYSATVRFYIGVEEEAQAIIDFVKSHFSKKKVAILYASEAQWIAAIKDIYNPQLGTILQEPLFLEQYNVKDKDFRSQVTHLKQAQVEVIIILGYGFEFGPLFLQLHESGLMKTASIIGGWGFLYTPVPSEQLEGVYVAGPMYVYQRNMLGKEFDVAYESKYGHKPNFDAAFAYELAKRIPDVIQIIKEYGSDGLKTQLVKQGVREGVFGNYHFSPDGNMVVETAVGVYRSGTIIKE
jgi:ABC-type branched-subunit amino acid transport system substrate-binding protein